jgi:uncharacterized membrane protein YpjA
MVFDFADINWLAVIVAAVLGVAIGFAWYMPQVFGRRWAATIGRDLPDSGAVSPAIYLVNVVQALVVAYVLALLIDGLGVVSLAEGLIVGFVVWLGFAAVPTLNSVLFERRSLEYWVINAGYGLVSILAMAAVIALMGA